MSAELKVRVQCPDHDLRPVGYDQEGQQKLKIVFVRLAELKGEVHQILETVGANDNHPELAKIINEKCNGTHTHGHQCEDHTKGHHHETVEVDGKLIPLCDPASLGQELDSLDAVLANCGEGDCDHAALERLLKEARGKQEEMKKLYTFCIKEICHTCQTEKRSHSSLRKPEAKQVSFVRK